jgi:hypothetical protein
MNQESGELNGSRKALSEDENLKLGNKIKVMPADKLQDFLSSEIDQLNGAGLDVKEVIEKKLNKHFPDAELPEELNLIEWNTGITAEINKAPAIISKVSSSDDIPLPPKEDDVIYVDGIGNSMEFRINALDKMLVPYPDAPNSHTGPFIERCGGVDHDSKKKMMVRVKAKWVTIEPWMVVQYLGNVIMDHQSDHSETIMYKKNRIKYVFDRTYIDPRNGKEYERCCLITDRIHQAGLVFEKVVHKQTFKAFARVRRMRGPGGQPTDSIQYRVIGNSEGDNRDLRRLYERHFMSAHKNQEELADSIGLKALNIG